MGEKDYQQLYLVKKYLEKKYRSKVILCKTIREKNKLALSSRNLHLKKKEIIQAGSIAKNLLLFKKSLINKKDLDSPIFLKRKELEKLFKIKIEYFELRNKYDLKVSKKIKNSKLFIAYYLNKIRLIDNF